VLAGWVKTYMEGQGETLLKEGNRWTSRPHQDSHMDDSDDVGIARSDPAGGVQDGPKSQRDLWTRPFRGSRTG